MTIRELIEQHAELLNTFRRNGVAVNSAKYLPIYYEYTALVNKGHKKTYAAAVVADKHGVSERWVYAVVNFMNDSVV